MAASRALTPTEQSAMLAVMKRRRDRLLLLFGVHAGFRIFEMLPLRFRDVWREGGPARTVTVTRARMKGGRGPHARSIKSRTVPLHAAVQAALQSYVVQRFPEGQPDPDAVVFLSREGDNRPISYVQAYRILHDAADAVTDGDRVGCHSGRKTFARSVHERSGHNLVLTQRALGHASLLSTSAYLESAAADVEAVILDAVSAVPAVMPTATVEAFLPLAGVAALSRDIPRCNSRAPAARSPACRL